MTEPTATPSSTAATTPVGFLTRLGLALVEPRWAFAVAGDRRHPGRSGSDLMRVIGLLLLGGHVRGLVVAAWLAAAVDSGFGLRMGGAVLSAALTAPLAFLVIAAGLLFAASGRARHLGRAFDLACVAAVPLLLVLLVGVALTQLFELHHSPAMSLLTLGAGFGWAGALASLALAPARQRVSVAAVPPADVRARGRRAGLAAIAVAAAMAALQLGWIALHTDELRPVAPQDQAPAFALAEVGPDGELLAKVAVTPGKAAAPETSARPIVLDFWATWCGVCLRGLPALEELRKSHPEVNVISVNLDDAAVARKIFDAKGYGLRLLFDDGLVSQRFNVSALPHLVVIGVDGKVHHVVRGHPGELEALLPPHRHAER